jgi:aspartate carbamoyltransferase catalytic subunit
MAHNFKNRDIISINDLSKSDILDVLEVAKELKKKQRPKLLENYVMGSCFFEPSTRTRLSFETAMNRLGGKVIGFADPKMTSTKKGESLFDTIKMVSQYVDVIAMRHSIEGSARLASEASDVPIINGGDGANQHPTQTLLDLFTIKETQKKLTGLNIAMIGDLKFGRTVHSLAEALKHFNPRLYLVAPDELQMPNYILENLRNTGVKFSLHQKIESVIKKVDIFYMTRIQEERFVDKLEFERFKNAFVLRPKHLESVLPNMKVMHPLPRIDEIDISIDSSKHAYYFEQAKNGLYTRQALLALTLGKINH